MARNSVPGVGDLPPILTVREAAAYLGLSVPTVYRAIRAGTIPTIQITPGGRFFIARKALEQLVSGD